MATVDLAMGETVTGASRFVAGLLQLALLAIGIVIGAELVGNPHTGPVAGAAADTLGSWAPWAGVAVFGVGVYIHNSAPKRSLPWLLVVLFTAWAGQLAGKDIIDATLSGFIGAAVMVPVAHLVAHARTAPPAHVMFLPSFWLLVPGTIGLIGITELVGDEPRRPGRQNLGTALVAIPAVALGILVGTMVVRAVRIAMRTHIVRRRPSLPRSMKEGRLATVDAQCCVHTPRKRPHARLTHSERRESVPCHVGQRSPAPAGAAPASAGALQARRRTRRRVRVAQPVAVGHRRRRRGRGRSRDLGPERAFER